MVLPTECIHFPGMECQLDPATFCSQRMISSAQRWGGQEWVLIHWGLGWAPAASLPSPAALETLAGPSSEPALPHRCGNCQMLWWFKCAVEARIKGWCPQLMLSKAAGECYRCGCRWIGGGRPRAHHLFLNRCLTLYFPGGQKEPDYSASVEAMRDRTSSPALARGGSQALGFHPSAHKTGSYSQNFSVGDFIPTLNFNG